MDLGCFKWLAVALLFSCARAQEDCVPSLSFDVGPFTYHLVSDCVGPLSMAMEECQTLNGTLALLRSEEAVQTIVDFVFDNVQIFSTSTPPATTTNATTTTSTETTTITATTTPAPSYLQVYTFFAAPFVTFPTTTCSFLRFWKDPLRGYVTRYQVDIIDDCDESLQIFPWICETMSENYEPEAQGVVLRARVEQTVMDYRPSAIAVGSSGIAMIVVVFMVILAMDISKYIDGLRLLLSNRKALTDALDEERFRTTSPCPAEESMVTTLSSPCPSNQAIDQFYENCEMKGHKPRKIYSSD